jgi:murein DD-endopeptidase MepM/ murein hydrolase activator NlpD
MVTKLLPLLAIVFTTASFASGAVSSSKWTVRTQPRILVNGSPVVFQVKPPKRLSSLSASWMGHEVFFDYNASNKTWYGFAGIGLNTRPAHYVLELRGTAADGTEASNHARLAVGAAKYRTIKITVARRFTEPDEEQLKRIKSEVSIKKDLLNRVDPDGQWSGRFRPPVSAPISGLFGTRRTLNGEVQSTHEGLDYAVPTGTPIAALNRGTVLLARPLYFEGNCVVLDHGQGLMSIYMHLSKIEVREGELVGKGKEIGLSGGTGRSTGPHLHVSVRWQGLYLNPATVMALILPSVPRAASTPPTKANAETSGRSGSHPSGPDSE